MSRYSPSELRYCSATTTNTDARDISLMLSELGINVKYHTVVGDNPPAPLPTA